jgi:hypothetical protein
MAGNPLCDDAGFVAAGPERVQPNLNAARAAMSATSEYRA